MPVKVSERRTVSSWEAEMSSQRARMRSTSPKRSAARRRASSVGWPPARSSSVSMSRWKRSSSSTAAGTSRSACGRRKTRRRSGRRGMGWPEGGRGAAEGSGGGEDLRHGRGVAGPRARLGAELGAAASGEAVVLGAPVVLREPPLGLDPAALLQAVEGGVEGALLDAEGVVGRLADPARDGVAVARAPAEGLEDEDVERALEELERVGSDGHRDSP